MCVIGANEGKLVFSDSLEDTFIEVRLGGRESMNMILKKFNVVSIENYFKIDLVYLLSLSTILSVIIAFILNNRTNINKFIVKKLNDQEIEEIK